MAHITNALVALSIFLTFIHTSWCNAHSPAALSERQNTEPHPVLESSPSISWLYESSEVPLNRQRRDASGKQSSNRVLPDKNLIDEVECLDDIKRLCGALPPESDDLTVLECIQTLKANDVSQLTEECQHTVWTHSSRLLEDAHLKEAASSACSQELTKLSAKCDSEGASNLLGCLMDHREELQYAPCRAFVQRVEYVAFSDYRFLPRFSKDCSDDIMKLHCARLELGTKLSQGRTLVCLQKSLDSLSQPCHRQVLRISEQQAEDIKLDRQLFLACAGDHVRFCSSIPDGSGQVYRCLLQHRTDRSMSRACQEHLGRRQRLIAADYKVSRGLARSCKEDIRTYHCRRAVSEDKDIRLAQILLCLEGVIRNGSKVTLDCQQEMMDHRKILLEDYRLSPEIVSGCADDIRKHCSGGVEVGGKTIHCLMEHSRTKRRKDRITSVCQRALEALVQETDAGEDWRVDPVLREACQPVVDSSCSHVRGGDARVMQCLMERIGTDHMRAACEAALLQIQYFVARDYKLDPPLYRECRDDANRFCHAKKTWSDDPAHMDPERGPMVLPCLYRIASQDPPQVKLRPGCAEELRRVMRQHALSVDLEPEVQDSCLDELAQLCPQKTGKGEETLCLQDNLEKLGEKCRQAVGNLTEQQAEHVELNPIIWSSCHSVMQKHCETELQQGRDEGDIMECLIKHKNEPEVRAQYKCRAAVEHFQLITIKNYHFTYKFKQACRPYVVRYCPLSLSKSDVIVCLSELVRNATLSEQKHTVSKECRQQLRAQLLQQRENIEFDPKLKASCAKDIRDHCGNVQPGAAQVLECLQASRRILSAQCHRAIFKVERQQLTDSSIDYALLTGCQHALNHYCHDVPMAQALTCLKRYRNEAGLDSKCRALVFRRMVEQSEDYRLNPALQQSCHADITKFCAKIVATEPADHELEGKVVKCLKGKFREQKLSNDCERQMADIMREAALNYKLNPVLAAACRSEINSQCLPSGGNPTGEGEANEDEEEEEDGSGAVEECLKRLLGRNQLQDAQCRLEVAAVVEDERADIHTDPLLHNACAIDLAKFCADVPAGAGQQIRCLQLILPDSRRALEPKCRTMLSSRMDMFRSADNVVAPETIQELYTSVSKSKSRQYFLVVCMTCVGVVFVLGLFCGRVSRRTLLMKNK